MLILLSPAKTLDFDTPPPHPGAGEPDLLDRSQTLVAALRKLSRPKLAALMSISDTLADENARRYKQWSRPFTAANAKPAVFAFRGDVYQGLEADGLSKRDLDWAQKHLRILSGLHGVLRPLDLIQPYRLEMGTALKVGRRKSLYEFWGEDVTVAVAAAMRAVRSRLLVNLASKEYFGVIDPEGIDGRIVTPVFKERRGGELKLISFSAKRARGTMARFLIETRAGSVDDIRKFDRDGYRFQKSGSTEHAPLFVRPGP